jgi:xylulokinase
VSDGSVLTVDVGGTNLRAGLLDRSGHTLAVHAVASPRPTGSAGAAELDPESWWHGFLSCAEHLAAAAPSVFEAVQAVAITGMTRTQVFLGPDGNVVRPAMTWADTRAADLVPELLGAVPTDHPERGQINAYHPLARLAWLHRHEPEMAKSLAAVVEPKDFLALCLSGEAATDSISAARLVASAAAASGGSLIERAGLTVALPRLLEPLAIVGAVRAGLPGALASLARRPVTMLANDTWCAVLGLGALREGLAYTISGTTEVLGLLSARAAVADGLVSVAWGSLHHLGGPSQNGADAVAWALGLLGREGATPDALLEHRGDPQPLLFLPYLNGERVPYWDPALRGALVGLNRRHGPGDIVRAVLEGVAFQNRLVLERAEIAVDAQAREIRFGGGGAASRAWAQIKADVTNRPVVTTQFPEPGLAGAALAAWTALGAYPDLEAAQDTSVPNERFEPDPARTRHYDALYRLFRQAEEAVRPITAALAQMVDPP